jgi:hypothetical protein
VTKRTRRVINMHVGDDPLVLTSNATASGAIVLINRSWSVQNLTVLDGVPGGMWKETLTVTPKGAGQSDVTCTITMGMSETITETVTFYVSGLGMVDTLEITGGQYNPPMPAGTPYG